LLDNFDIEVTDEAYDLHLLSETSYYEANVGSVCRILAEGRVHRDPLIEPYLRPRMVEKRSVHIYETHGGAGR
jgi:hypothetical protein